LNWLTLRKRLALSYREDERLGMIDREALRLCDAEAKSDSDLLLLMLRLWLRLAIAAPLC